MKSDMVSYYKERANEYEKIYDKPERQNDLLQLTKALQDSFSGKHVLEVACGTGYWTQRIAQTAKSVLATDINEAVIEIAGSKSYGHAEVSFQVADMFKFAAQPFDALFGGFIWSHIKLEELDKFIQAAHNLVKPGGMVVFIDNSYHEASSTPISNKDEQGNTYQIRKLENGNTYSILKNFPSGEFVQQSLRNCAGDIEFKSFEYYWIVTYTRK